jgi:hypothetical protein
MSWKTNELTNQNEPVGSNCCRFRCCRCWWCWCGGGGGGVGVVVGVVRLQLVHIGCEVRGNIEPDK